MNSVDSSVDSFPENRNFTTHDMIQIAPDVSFAMNVGNTNTRYVVTHGKS